MELLFFAIQTDKNIRSNRPDIVVKDYKRKTCLLFDMLTSVKEYNKISKCKDLE